jgi:class 3 adenylate cyclase/tetratricopeptide (TPR) repeat protein
MVSAAAARKTVSVLFCDLADSTALGERLDPEPLRELMGRWYDEMRSAVERHGGTVEKFVGDAVMAIFGVPRAHEDDALRAIRAALEMQSAVKRLNAAAAGRDGPELRLRIGINTGEVVTGEGAATLATGDAVNTAKRLEEAAGAGEILVGAVTERLVRHAALLEAVDPVAAKGKGAPVAAWRVVHAVPDAEPFARRWDTPLVGRTRELAVLRDELAAGSAVRACRLVTVLGEAGVGKTRLVSELVAEVGESAKIVSGRCLPYGDGITFWPVAELIRTLGGDTAVAEAARDEPDAALIVERLRALGDGGAPTEELFWAVRRLFEALARERPLVVVLEDLHWAEPTLLDLVEHVSRWSRDAPILLLGLARPELLEERPRWEGVLLRLGSLTPDEAAQLVEALDDDGVLSQQVRARVNETAQGNPLYAEQLVAMISETGTDAALPPTIQALLAARLDHIDPVERDVLERAAVVGREFWPGAVAALGERTDDAVGTTLLELVRLDFVEPAPPSVPGEDGFRFRHALIRDAAYGSTPLRRRAAHHERFADWLASVGEANEYDEIRGYHLEQAVLLRRELGSETERDATLAAHALELLSRAGLRAYARGDVPAARNLLARGLALGPDGPGEDLELRRILARALWETGETDSALDLVEQVASAAAAAGDRAEEWYARLDAAGMRGAGAPDGLVSFLETASQAVEVFSELDDERGLAQAWRRISRAEIVRCSYAAAEAAAVRALRYALGCGERVDAAWAADGLGTALLWGPTPVADALRRCDELIAEAGENAMLRANVLAALSGLRALEGDIAAARGLRAEAEDIYRDLGQRMSIAGLTQVAAQIERLAENPAAAEAELRNGLEILHGTGSEALQQAWLSAALVAQGRYEEAREPAEAARAIASTEDVLDQVVWRGALARVEAATGDLKSALSLARNAVDQASLTDGLTMQADALIDLAAVLRVAGDTEEAERSANEAVALYKRKGAVARISLAL